MLKDITLGQYVPGDSLLHRLDPRSKIIGSMLYIVALFLLKSPAGYAVMTVFTAALVLLSALPLGYVLRGRSSCVLHCSFYLGTEFFPYTGTSCLEAGPTKSNSRRHTVGYIHGLALIAAGSHHFLAHLNQLTHCPHRRD